MKVVCVKLKVTTEVEHVAPPWHTVWLTTFDCGSVWLITLDCGSPSSLRLELERLVLR